MLEPAKASKVGTSLTYSSSLRDPRSSLPSHPEVEVVALPPPPLLVVPLPRPRRLRRRRRRLRRSPTTTWYVYLTW